MPSGIKSDTSSTAVAAGTQAAATSTTTEAAAPTTAAADGTFLLYGDFTHSPHPHAASLRSYAGSAGWEDTDAPQTCPVRGRRSIPTVLSSELEPVTEIPGEGLCDSDDDWEGGRGSPRPVRRNSGGGNGCPGGRSHRRRRSSSGSSSHRVCVVEEEVEGGGARGGREEGCNGEERGEDEEEDEDSYYVEQPVGLAVEVRVSAPVICVLLVHDRSGDNSEGSVSAAEAAAEAEGAVSPDKNAVLPAELLAGYTPDFVADGDDRVPGGTPPVPAGDITDGKCAADIPTGNEGDLGEGALVLVEVYGLGMEYRDIGGGGGGDTDRIELDTQNMRKAASAAARATRRTRVGGGGGGSQQPTTMSSRFSLTAVSFRVKDMFQQGGDPFSYLLSSTAPPSLLRPSGTGNLPGRGGACLPGATAVSEVPTPLAGWTPLAENALNITRAFSENGAGGGGGDGGDGGGGGGDGLRSRTTITVGGVWANWNPETVAALSIFAYGMYGNGRISGRGSDGRTHDSGGIGGGDGRGNGGGGGGGVEGSPPARVGPGDSAVGGFYVVGGGPCAPPETAEGCVVEDDVARESGVVVVEVKRLSLWLNKEVHGRRLLLLEAGESSVRLCEHCVCCFCYCWWGAGKGRGRERGDAKFLAMPCRARAWKVAVTCLIHAPMVNGYDIKTQPSKRLETLDSRIQKPTIQPPK